MAGSTHAWKFCASLQNQNSPLCAIFKGGEPTMTMEQNISGIKMWRKRGREVARFTTIPSEFYYLMRNFQCIENY